MFISLLFEGSLVLKFVLIRNLHLIHECEIINNFYDNNNNNNNN